MCALALTWLERRATTVRQGERVQQLRPIVHPGQADTLVHFCGRARPTNAPEVAFLSPEERLSNIVAEEVLRAHPTYGNPNSVVCFSESDHGGVEADQGRDHCDAPPSLARPVPASCQQYRGRQRGSSDHRVPAGAMKDGEGDLARRSLGPQRVEGELRDFPEQVQAYHDREVACRGGGQGSPPSRRELDHLAPVPRSEPAVCPPPPWLCPWCMNRCNSGQARRMR